jgi:delta 1-pyrroline-5-carboxylate dehydrogenase
LETERSGGRMIMDELAEHEVVYSAIKSSEKRTNFERIKNMSVEEMARILHIISRENGKDINKRINNCDCWTADFLKWLNSESEV